MTDQLAHAVLAAAEGGAPAKTWSVDHDALVTFGDGRNPFDGMIVTHWTRD